MSIILRKWKEDKIRKQLDMFIKEGLTEKVINELKSSIDFNNYLKSVVNRNNLKISNQYDVISEGVDFSKDFKGYMIIDLRYIGSYTENFNCHLEMYSISDLVSYLNFNLPNSSDITFEFEQLDDIHIKITGYGTNCCTSAIVNNLTLKSVKLVSNKEDLIDNVYQYVYI